MCESEFDSFNLFFFNTVMYISSFLMWLSTDLPAPVISQEQAEHLESVYIDIRDDVLSNDLRPDQVRLEGKLGQLFFYSF